MNYFIYLCHINLFQMENQEELKARMVIVKDNLTFCTLNWDMLEASFAREELERLVNRLLDDYIDLSFQLKG